MRHFRAKVCIFSLGSSTLFDNLASYSPFTCGAMEKTVCDIGASTEAVWPTDPTSIGLDPGEKGSKWKRDLGVVRPMVAAIGQQAQSYDPETAGVIQPLICPHIGDP